MAPIKSGVVPDKAGDIPVMVHVPLLTVVVNAVATPFLYKVITVPFASVDVPLTLVAKFCMGAVIVGHAERKPAGEHEAHVGVWLLIKLAKPVSLLAPSTPAISDIFDKWPIVDCNADILSATAHLSGVLVVIPKSAVRALNGTNQSQKTLLAPHT